MVGGSNPPTPAFLEIPINELQGYWVRKIVIESRNDDGMIVPGMIRILRPVNSLVAGIAAVLAFFIATGTLVPFALILIPIVFCITAAGNIANDYYDVPIDAINRPDRPLPSGEITPRTALLLTILLFLAGVLLTIPTNPVCLLIVLINSILLILYAARLKRMAFIGNGTVAYLSGSVFLFGGALAGGEGILHIAPIVVITILAMISRELLKAAEDLVGDATAGARTLPIIIGVKKTAILAFLFSIGAVAASVIPYIWWGPWYLAGIAFIDLIILIGAARALACNTPACVSASRSTEFLKIGMFASLLVFTLAALFL
jgi:geranylgeranylglycerol-phosphate geranylgeranyltransferase